MPAPEPARPTDARRRLMQAVKRQDTAPELLVRRYLHAQGLRYALHRADLPGRPDIVLTRRATVVFVHGCFWHGHRCRHGRIAAKTNSQFWQRKIADNQARDRRQSAALRQLGWQVETVWECECRRPDRLARLVARLRAR